MTPEKGQASQEVPTTSNPPSPLSNSEGSLGPASSYPHHGSPRTSQVFIPIPPLPVISFGVTVREGALE